jgi:transcriptional regulator with XRE-family HTH domain
MTFEDRIKKARNFAELTQQQLAKLIDVSLATIKNYEKDASAAKVCIVLKIASACNVDEGWLVTGRGHMSAQPHITESEKIKRIIIEHQGVVKNLKDPERARDINKRLLEIEELSEKIYDRVDTYIEAARDSARAEKGFKKTRKIRKGPRKIPSSIPKESANGN